MKPERRDLLFRVLASAACGNMMWLAAPDVDIWWLGFVAWIPWLWAIDGQGPKRALLIGWVAGFCSVFVGFFWLTELLTRFAGLPMWLSVIVHVFFSLWHGLQWGLPAMVIEFIRKRNGRTSLMSAPLAWAACEVVFPWVFPVYIGMLWAWHPLWLQGAELGGPAVIGFTMLGINAALYQLGRTWFADKRFDPKLAAVAAAWLIGVPAYGAVRMAQVDAQIEAAPKFNIGVVQGNFGIKTRNGNQRRVLRTQQRMSRKLADEGAELILWGETAYPYGRVFRNTKHEDERRKKRRARRGFDVPLLFGTVTTDRSQENPFPWNTAQLIESDGTYGDRYDKVHPLLFGESVPFVDPHWYLEMVPSAAVINTGPGAGVIELDQWRLGPMICYEDLLPDLVRETVDLDVHVLVNLTNDSWFGKSREQGEHLSLAVLRSIEHRRALVRAVNAGVSAHVDPAGRVVQRLDSTDSDTVGFLEAEGFVAQAAMMDPKSRTIYGRTGHLFALLLWLGCIGLGWRRGPSAPGPTPQPAPEGEAEGSEHASGEAKSEDEPSSP